MSVPPFSSPLFLHPSNTMSSLSGRVIAITGAASGIGLATAHLLASHSATLCLSDLNFPLLESASQSIRQTYPSVSILLTALDVRNETEVEKWIDTIVSAHGRLDGAVNMAGVIGRGIGSKGVVDLDLEEWEYVLGVNLRGVMVCLKYELRAMLACEGGGKGRGSVVNASSIAGVRGMV